jgi:hypothetical protein
MKIGEVILKDINERLTKLELQIFQISRFLQHRTLEKECDKKLEIGEVERLNCEKLILKDINERLTKLELQISKIIIEQKEKDWFQLLKDNNQYEDFIERYGDLWEEVFGGVERIK